MLSRIKALRPTLPVVLITAWGIIDLAVRGMKAGAADFVTKPWTQPAAAADGADGARTCRDDGAGPGGAGAVS